MSSNPRRTNSAARDKVRRRVLREESMCALCGQPVDKTLPPRLPGSPEIDEIVPVSKGGSPYQRSNCQLTHRWCNQHKGNRQTSAKPPPFLEPLATERDWTWTSD